MAPLREERGRRRACRTAPDDQDVGGGGARPRRGGAWPRFLTFGRISHASSNKMSHLASVRLTPKRRDSTVKASPPTPEPVMSMAPQESELAPLPEEPSPEPAASQRSATRRQLFTLGAAVAVATLAPLGKASAQRVVRPPVRRPSEPDVGGDVLVRLVRRVTNGVTEEEVARAKSLGFRKYLEYHLK